jgi:hypothetical protein
LKRVHSVNQRAPQPPVGHVPVNGLLKACVGPFTSFGENRVVRGAEVENTIIVGDCRIECRGRIVDSLIGFW